MGCDTSDPYRYIDTDKKSKEDFMRKWFVVFVICSLLAIVIAACGDNEAGSSTDGPNTVHTNDLIFLKDQMTIKKGQSITVINDVGTEHIIANGTWDNSIPKSLKEQGAPSGEVDLAGNETKIIGPFNTAGVFHLYCTIHPNMNLTVTVQG
jgi:plastocyanin